MGLHYKLLVHTYEIHYFKGLNTNTLMAIETECFIVHRKQTNALYALISRHELHTGLCHTGEYNYPYINNPFTQRGPIINLCTY